MKDKRVDVLLAMLNIHNCKHYEYLCRGLAICKLKYGRGEVEYPQDQAVNCDGELKSCELEGNND